MILSRFGGPEHRRRFATLPELELPRIHPLQGHRGVQSP